MAPSLDKVKQRTFFFDKMLPRIARKRGTIDVMRHLRDGQSFGVVIPVKLEDHYHPLNPPPGRKEGF